MNLTKEQIEGISHKSVLSRKEAMYYWNLSKEDIAYFINHRGMPYIENGPKKKTFHKETVNKYFAENSQAKNRA